ALVFLVVLAVGALLLAGVVLALLLRGHPRHAAPATTTSPPSTTAPPATTTQPPPTTTAPPPPPPGPLQAVAVAPFSATVRWTGPSPPALVAYGLPDLGPTMWAPVTGQQATLAGLRFSTVDRLVA